MNQRRKPPAAPASRAPVARKRAAGFTLIELSIVLVIIGLVVGGVLVGQDLIKAAQVRATITQIEKLNTAVNTFYVKYGYLPGDIPNPSAVALGFAARGTNCGQGDGNGIIESYNSGACNGSGAWGETTMFWEDLTYANGQNLNLIEGSFSTATSTTFPAGQVTGSAINLYLPQAKLGQGNYIYAYSGGGFASSWVSDNINYFGLGAVTDMEDPGSGFSAGTGLTVQQAYNIDKKLDDAVPNTGNVIVQYVSSGTVVGPANNTGPTTGNASSCYDNGGNAGTAQTYDAYGGNTNLNCALSFVMQGAGR
jgi:prepilin-type N-terminal cleavage/methylation domain-containing protein